VVEEQMTTAGGKGGRSCTRSDARRATNASAKGHQSGEKVAVAALRLAAVGEADEGGVTTQPGTGGAHRHLRREKRPSEGVAEDGGLLEEIAAG
jgi:hypothetical protein